jgi:predicted glycoside hydrolase/deacetylase ChbG (UPF0249 family)
MQKRLIVNADDFGQSAGVNRGVTEANARGVVTSASLMVRWPAAAEAAAYAREHPDLSLGLHLDLGEWACRGGEWVALYEVVPLTDGAAVAGEVAAQLAAFQRLAGRAPTHLDSHQHVHLREPARAAVLAAGRRLGVPVRGCTPAVRYCGDFYGQTAEGEPLPEAISPARLVRIVAGLRPGTTELACHPGDGDDLQTMYRHERRQEVEALCDPLVRAALSDEGVTLCSFHAVTAAVAAEVQGGV